MKKIKILFRGDSITDADRDRSDYHNMGYGYANFVVQKLTAAYPDVEFEFINLGLSGNRTEQIALNFKCILERIKRDTKAKLIVLQPFTEGEDQARMQPDVDRLIAMVDPLAEKYADTYIRTNEIIHADENYGKEHYFTRDGVHPGPTGAEFIANLYVEAISPYINELIAK